MGSDESLQAVVSQEEMGWEEAEIGLPGLATADLSTELYSRLLEQVPVFTGVMFVGFWLFLVDDGEGRFLSSMK